MLQLTPAPLINKPFSRREWITTVGVAGAGALMPARPCVELRGCDDAAREFFTALLGWTYVRMPGMGHRMQVSGSDIGGIFDLNGPNTPAGTPRGIGLMVKVDSADAVVARINTLGGTAKPAFDIGVAGRMADCSDPNGAYIDIWEPKQSQGLEADDRLHGAPTWFETMTTDVERATKFYTELFGWTSRVMPMGEFDYIAFAHNGVDIAGMMPIMPEMGAMPAHWATYFTVNNVDEAAALAPTLGGSQTVPLTDIPNIGRFAGVVSPQGVMFYIIQYTS